MPSIVLATFNARYPHSAFGLRYLWANMGELQAETTILELGLQDRTVDVIDRLQQLQPQILGLGVYIWNVEITTRLVRELKQVWPDLIIVLGGPEVSYEWEHEPLVAAADYLITGEADLAFAKLCSELIAGQPPTERIIHAPIPALDEVRLPYELYDAEDIANRVIYVEASRGCPFTCEFCLSALDIPVRQFPLNEFLAAMQSLLDRGVRQFKFVDRTFNLNLRVSQAILRYFLERYEPGLFLHFEMIPDRLPDGLSDLIRQFPAGALQFEIGVQTFNDDVGGLISRRQNNWQLEENFRFLREQTGVHIHADLIVGLPCEDVKSFGTGFDRLIALGPQEIQVGMLKRLKGTPIVRHEAEYQLVYSPYSPYEILSTSLIDFAAMHRLRRFARYWDLIGNSGHFLSTREFIWSDGRSPFESFMKLSDYLFAASGRTHGISLVDLSEHVFRFLTERDPDSAQTVALRLWEDYTRGGREDRPLFLQGFDLPSPRTMHPDRRLPQRQARHQAGYVSD